MCRFQLQPCAPAWPSPQYPEILAKISKISASFILQVVHLYIVPWQLAEIHVLISSCEHSKSPQHKSISKILTRRACYTIYTQSSKENDCSGDFGEDQKIYLNYRHPRLPHAATCNTLKHTAAAQDAPSLSTSTSTTCRYPQHTATHWNTLQHTATRCITLQHTATHCNIYNKLQQTATHYKNMMYLVHQHPCRPNAADLSRPADRLRARAVPNHRLCVYLHICIFTYICI